MPLGRFSTSLATRAFKNEEKPINYKKVKVLTYKTVLLIGMATCTNSDD